MKFYEIYCSVIFAPPEPPQVDG